jgi:ABC-type antimicrobial peptide transport system permease subunit
VGVVSTVRMMPPFNIPNVDASGFYVPFYSPAAGPAAQSAIGSQFATIVVRPHPGQRPESLVTTLQREVNQLDPNLPLYFVGTPKQNIDSFVSQNRIIAGMFSAFGLVAVVLAAVGIYSVMSFSVNRRTQEFGVRMALGARPSQILGMVLKQGAWQVALGLTLGLSLAFVFAVLGGSAIGTILYGVTPRDPLTYTAVSALVAIVSLLAVLVPGRRALRVDPIIALRE